MTEWFKRNKYIERYRRDYEFKTVVNALFSSLATAAAGTFHLLIALFAGGNPIWLFTLSAYYYALAAARVAVLLSHRIGLRRKENEEKRFVRDARNYLSGGALLVFLTIVYSGIAVLVAVKNFHYEYRGNLIYAMAFYCFWKIISSIVNAVKRRKLGDYTVQTLCNINVADGIVSVVALQSAMLFTFSSAEESLFAYTMNAAVGGVAGALILALGSYMIVKGTELLKRGSSRTEPEEP